MAMPPPQMDMVQPCDELDMETKCQLLHANLPKISTVFLQESETCSKDEGSVKHRQDFDSLKSEDQDMPMVGMEAMQDTNSTLGDFGGHVCLLSAFSEMGLKLRLDALEQAMEVNGMFFRTSSPATEALENVKAFSERGKENMKVIQDIVISS